MPMNRHNSASALYSSNPSTTATNSNSNNASRSSKMPNNNNNNDSSFDGSTGGNVFSNSGSYYRSSPDLGPASHRRYSSTDSMDGGSSHHSGHSGGHSGGHSRQGSTSEEISYPTRRLSQSLARRQSTSADPLQFIKSKGAQDLAQIAQVQMKVAAESKKESAVTRTREDDIDWQANLSTWKNRRKSQSERSYQLREELEQMEKEKEEGGSGPVLPTKTYSQIQEERERRKSTGRKFYPIEDEEEDNDEIFKPTSVGRLESSLPPSNLAKSKDDQDQLDAKSTENQNDGNNNKNKYTSSKESNGSDNNSFMPSTRSRQPFSNNSNNGSVTSSGDDQPTPASLLSERRASRSKLSEKLRSYDEDAEESRWSSRSQTNEEQTPRQRRAGIPDYSAGGGGLTRSSASMDNGVSNSASNDSESSRPGHSKESSMEDNSDNSRTDSVTLRHSSRDTLSSDGSSRKSATLPRSYGGTTTGPSSSNSTTTTTTTTGSVKLTTTRSVGSRTQSKIGSIMRNFEEGDAKQAAPKQGYNERINLSARKSAFEITTPRDEPTGVTRSGSNAAAGNNSGRVPWSPYQVDDEDEDSSSSGGDDEDEGDDVEENRGIQEKIEVEHKQMAFSRLPQDSNNSNHSAKPWTASTAPSQSAGTNFSSSSAAVASRSAPDDSQKDYVEKTVKISQAKNSDRGFGFFLTGGADTDSPLAVSKVALGSSADVCDLRVKDEVQSVNQQDVTAMTATQVGDIVARAVAAGFIELRVRREKGEDNFEDEEDFSSSSDEGEEDCASPGYKNSQVGETSVMDQLAAERQWLEQQIQEGERNSGDKGDDSSNSQEGHVEAGEIQLTTHTVTLNTTLPVSRAPADQSISSASQGGEDSGPGGEGPPAVLRKWQRQRQKEEYTFDSLGGGSDNVTDTFRKISLNTAPPRQQSLETTADTTPSEFPPPPPAGTAEAWDHRHDQWTREQDARRQHGIQGDASSTQAEFEENQERMKAAYEEDVRRAEEKEEERKRQEMEMLQPEIDKAQLLEERRAERRARIFNTAAAATSSPPPSSSSSSSSSAPPVQLQQKDHAHRRHLYGDQFDAQADPAPVVPSDSGSGVHSSAVVFHVASPQLQRHQQQQQQQQQQHQPSFRSVVAPSQQEGVFVIDPRNRQEQSEYSAKPVAFHVNLGGVRSDSPGQDTASMLEAERERIRLEELRKIEEERKRAQEEMKAKEEEEMRKIKEKEEELQKEKEMLRQERERFLREQEEFKRLREQQQQQQQQQQQLQQRQQQQPSVQQPAYTAPSQRSYQSQQPNNSINNSSYNRSGSNNLTPRSNNASNNLPKWPPVSSATSTSTSNNAATFGKPSSNSTGSSNSSNASGSSDQVRRARGFSREEMLSPRQPQQTHSPAHGVRDGRREWHSPVTSDNLQQQQQQQQLTQNQHPHHQHHTQPNQQQHHSPSQHQRQQQQQNSLAPTSSDRGRDRSPTAPSTGMKNSSPFPKMGDHWLVEEAERRRVAESEGRLQHSPNRQGSALISGPIRPHAELPNRWRGDSGARSQQAQQSQPSGSMPAAIRQTLLLKTANARGGSASSNDSDFPLPPPPPPHDPNHLSPASHSPALSPARSPSGHRSVSPPGNRHSPSYSHHPSQQQHHQYQQQQQQHHPHQQQQQYRQQIHIHPQQQNYHQQPHNYNNSNHHQHQQQLPQYIQAPSPYNKSPQYQDPPGSKQTYGQLPPAPLPPPPAGENGLPVSGAQLCSYCDRELGFGAAMVIESLGLFYHVNCFRCCVCHTSLGTGAQGADVRVRANRLHCPDCYSNDEAGLKFSKV